MSDVLPEVDSSSSSEAPPSNGTNSTGGFDGFHPTWGSVNYTLPTLIVVAVVLFVVIVATAFGNFLVVLALLKYRSLRTISNYLIGNLALGDFLLATTILPLSTVNECLGHWVFGRALCNAWLIMDALYCTASIWNILAISFDRFTATLYPIWYREKRSTKKAAVYVALVWLISCAICLPPVVGWNDLAGNYIYEGNVYKCIVFQTPSYVLYSACGSFYIPFVMTFVFYMAIFIALRDRMMKTRKARTSTTTTTTTTTTDKRKLESRQKAPDAKRHGPASKSHRLQKEYRLELVKTDDRKKAAAADATDDGNSSRSLFGSDSDREERSASDVDADETTIAAPMTSQETEITRVARDESSADDVIRRDSVHSNGFAPMTSRHVIGDDEVNSSSSRSSSDRPAFISASAKDETNNVELNRSLNSISAEERRGASVSQESVRLNPVKSSTVVTTNEGVAKHGGAQSSTTKAAKHHHQHHQHHHLQHQQQQQQQQHQQQGRRGRYEQREMRATVRMAIIVASFCGMWIGFFTVYVVDSWCGGGCIPRELYAFFFWLGYSNSSVNPILYTIFNDDFRKAFVKIVGCHVTRKTKR